MRAIDTNKIRSKEKNKKKFFAPLLSAFLIAITLLSLYILMQYNNYRSFVNKQNNLEESMDIDIPKGSTTRDVAMMLVEKGILQDKTVFGIPAYKLYLRFNSFDGYEIRSGTNEIPANATVEEIFNTLHKENSGDCKEITVTLREGLRIEQFGEEIERVLTEEDKNFSYDEFVRIAKNFEPSEDFNAEFTFPNNLEGYLFPDTYTFCHNVNSQLIIETLLKNFEKKVLSRYSEQIDKNPLNIEEIINIASMIERESKTKEDKRRVAEVILNRIENLIHLGIDATTQYEFGYEPEQKTWWRTGKALDSVINSKHKYNTRQNLGLPPTPISNPGIDSIEAVLNPSDDGWLYYINDSSGDMHFTDNLDEHNYNVCKYITRQCN